MEKKIVNNVNIASGNTIINSNLGIIIQNSNENKFLKELNELKNQLKENTKIDDNIKLDILELIQNIENSNNIEEYKTSAQEKFNSFFIKYGVKISSVIGIVSNLTSIASYFNI